MVSTCARKTPLKLLPAIALAARQKAKSINQPLSAYIAILLWNFAQAPASDLRAEPDSTSLARVHVPCSLRRLVWDLVEPHIEASGLSANAFIEALIARDLRSGATGLNILAARSSSPRRK